MDEVIMWIGRVLVALVLTAVILTVILLLQDIRRINKERMMLEEERRMLIHSIIKDIEKELNRRNW